MQRKLSILIGLSCVLAIARVSPAQITPASFSSISKGEIEILLADVARTNPMVVKKLAADPEMRRNQVESLRQTLAFASQAVRDGMANKPTSRQELENIQAEIVAVNYERELNKGKTPTPAFGSISDARVAAYWSEKGGAPGARSHDAEFNDFLNAKFEILRAGNPDLKDREITGEERAQARDVFARTRIYYSEYERKAKAGELPKALIDRITLQVKLQQAQYLARLYSPIASVQIQATDQEVASYIAGHSEFNTQAQRDKAQKILERAKAGEDFAKLADQFSQDPGNKDSNGNLMGGLYADVPLGRMVPPFEQAALSLQDGQIAPELVESDFGYHIIKLEKKTVGSMIKYDVRHILISTTIKDPEHPEGLEKSLKEYARERVEDQKEALLLNRLVTENHIEVSDDFEVPAVSDAAIAALKAKTVAAMNDKPTAAKKLPVKKKKKKPVKKHR